MVRSHVAEKEMHASFMCPRRTCTVRELTTTSTKQPSCDARIVLDQAVALSSGSVVGAYAVLKPDVSLAAETIVGAGATIPSGTRISGGRVPSERD